MASAVSTSRRQGGVRGDCRRQRGILRLTLILMLVTAVSGLRQTGVVLLVVGGFALFCGFAMGMRAAMAKGSGEPIPEDSDAYPEVKLGRWWLRGERRRAHIYRGLARGFHWLGVCFVVGGALALFASLV